MRRSPSRRGGRRSRPRRARPASARRCGPSPGPAGADSRSPLEGDPRTRFARASAWARPALESSMSMRWPRCCSGNDRGVSPWRVSTSVSTEAAPQSRWSGQCRMPAEVRNPMSDTPTPAADATVADAHAPDHATGHGDDSARPRRERSRPVRRRDVDVRHRRGRARDPRLGSPRDRDDVDLEPAPRGRRAQYLPGDPCIGRRDRRLGRAPDELAGPPPERRGVLVRHRVDRRVRQVRGGSRLQRARRAQGSDRSPGRRRPLVRRAWGRRARPPRSRLPRPRQCGLRGSGAAGRIALALRRLAPAGERPDLDQPLLAAGRPRHARRPDAPRRRRARPSPRPVPPPRWLPSAAGRTRHAQRGHRHLSRASHSRPWPASCPSWPSA